MEDSSVGRRTLQWTAKGDVYVTDWGNDRVQIYYADGEIIAGLYGDAPAILKVGTGVHGLQPRLPKGVPEG